MSLAPETTQSGFTMTINIKQNIQELRKYYYNLNWFGKLFIPRSLAEALSSPKVSEYRIYQLFFICIGWFHRFFFKGISQFSKLKTSQLTESIEQLFQKNLLSGVNADDNFCFCAQNAHIAANTEVLSLLHEAGLLKQHGKTLRETCPKNEAILNLLLLLKKLKEAGLLSNLPCVLAIMKRANKTEEAASLTSALIILKQRGLLEGHRSQENQNRLINHCDIISLNKLIKLLVKLDLFTEIQEAQENLDRAVSSTVPISQIHEQLKKAKKHPIMRGESAQLVCNYIMEGNSFSPSLLLLQLIPTDLPGKITLSNIELESAMRNKDSFTQFIHNNRTTPSLAAIYNLRWDEEKIRILSLLFSKMPRPEVANTIDWIFKEILMHTQPKPLITCSNIDWLCVEAMTATWAPHDINIFHALRALAINKILTQDKLDLFKKHTQLESLIPIVYILNRINLLTEENFTAIVNREDIQSIRKFLCRFLSHRVEGWKPILILKQKQLDAILNPNDAHSYLLNDEAYQDIDSIKDTWKDLFACCSQPNPKNTLNAFFSRKPQSEEPETSASISPSNIIYN